MMKRLRVAGLAVALIIFAGLVYADDVTDSIDEAMDSYKNGAYTEAVESLKYA